MTLYSKKVCRRRKARGEDLGCEWCRYWAVYLCELNPANLENKKENEDGLLSK